MGNVYNNCTFYVLGDSMMEDKEEEELDCELGLGEDCPLLQSECHCPHSEPDHDMNTEIILYMDKYGRFHKHD